MNLINNFLDNIENKRILPHFKISIETKLLFSLGLLLYFAIFKNFFIDNLELYEGFVKPNLLKDTPALQKFLTTKKKHIELSNLLDKNIFQLINQSYIFWNYQSLQNYIVQILTIKRMKSEEYAFFIKSLHEKFIYKIILKSFFYNFFFIFNITSNFSLAERMTLIISVIPQRLMHSLISYSSMTIQAGKTSKNTIEPFLKLVNLINKVDVKHTGIAFKNLMASISRKINSNQGRAQEVPTVFDFSQQDITSIAKSSFFSANIISLIIIGLKILPASRRGTIIKENLELFICAILVIFNCINKGFKLYRLEYATFFEKIFEEFLYILSISFGIIFLFLTSKCSALSPLNLSLIISCLCGFTVELSVMRKIFLQTGFYSFICKYVFTFFWTILFITFSLLVNTLKIVLPLTLEKSKEYRETQYIKVLQNVKSITFLGLLKDGVNFIFKDQVRQAQQTGSFLDLIFNYGLGVGAHFTYNLWSRSMYKELLVFSILSNTFLLVSNYIITYGFFEKQQIEMQARNLQKYGRTLVNCSGGYDATVKSLSQLSSNHNMLNTVLLIGLHNLGYFYRIVLFGNGSNTLHVIEGFTELRNTIINQIKAIDNHYLKIHLSEVF